MTVKALETVTIADSMEVTCVLREVFSDSVQVTEAEEISLAIVEILLLEGKLEAYDITIFDLVMISAQVAAVALVLIRLVVLLARLLIFVLAAVIVELLAERMAALAVCADVEVTQDKIAVMASSSYFLHTPKVVLQALSCVVMALALLLVLQFFSDWAVVFSLGPSQHPQASETLVLEEPILLPIQEPVSLMKLVTKVSHKEMSVVLGWGKLAGLQDLFTSISQSKRVLVRF